MNRKPVCTVSRTICAWCFVFVSEHGAQIVREMIPVRFSGSVHTGSFIEQLSAAPKNEMSFCHGHKTFCGTGVNRAHSPSVGQEWPTLSENHIRSVVRSSQTLWSLATPATFSHHCLCGSVISVRDLYECDVRPRAFAFGGDRENFTRNAVSHWASRFLAWIMITITRARCDDSTALGGEAEGLFVLR